MSALADDTQRTASGLGLAVLSALTFGLSGALARGLLVSGWSPAAAVTARVLVAAAVLLVPGLVSLRGRWSLLRRNVPVLLAYGVIAVAGCQLAYFSAVEHLQVGVALLIEYTAPVVVIAFLWLRHGQRPSRRTVAGAVIAGAGLVLVLDLVSGADLSLVGVVWALGATVGAAVYFVLSAREDDGLPPLALAGGGLLVGGLGLLVAAGLGLVSLEWSTRDAAYDGTRVAWWVPVLLLGVVTAALAYVAGIAASRRLGSRLASFVALLEVLFALLAAWLLLGELPHGIQFAGGVLVLAGVVVVKMGERSTLAAATPAAPPVTADAA